MKRISNEFDIVVKATNTKFTIEFRAFVHTEIVGATKSYNNANFKGVMGSCRGSIGNLGKSDVFGEGMYCNN